MLEMRTNAERIFLGILGVESIPLSWDWTRDIHRRDGFRCVYCGFDMSTFENWEFIQTDHFIPSFKGRYERIRQSSNSVHEM